MYRLIKIKISSFWNKLPRLFKSKKPNTDEADKEKDVAKMTSKEVKRTKKQYREAIEKMFKELLKGMLKEKMKEQLKNACKGNRKKVSKGQNREEAMKIFEELKKDLSELSQYIFDATKAEVAKQKKQGKQELIYEIAEEIKKGETSLRLYISEQIMHAMKNGGLTIENKDVVYEIIKLFTKAKEQAKRLTPEEFNDFFIESAEMMANTIDLSYAQKFMMSLTSILSSRMENKHKSQETKKRVSEIAVKGYYR